MLKTRPVELVARAIVLPSEARIRVEVSNPDRRPVRAVADGRSAEDVAALDISLLPNEVPLAFLEGHDFTAGVAKAGLRRGCVGERLAVEAHDAIEGAEAEDCEGAGLVEERHEEPALGRVLGPPAGRELSRVNEAHAEAGVFPRGGEL